MKTLKIIMNGVTGRMGTNQHLIRSIVAIREAGGVLLTDGTKVQVEPILVGRNAKKLESLAKTYQIKVWSTDLDATLESSEAPIFFDSASTNLRAETLKKAIDQGKHVYCEKPSAHDFNSALSLYHYAESKGVKHGVVQDKLFLPGLLKLQSLIDEEFFGRILSVRIEFGYWVFAGKDGQPQRPSWNYRAEDGGGIISDMMCHWQYIIENLFGKIEKLSCIGVTHIPQRYDEASAPYQVTADDAAYATLKLKNGIIVQVNFDWCTRVNRDDLVTFQVDGTDGSAVAGLTDCKVQSAGDTPRCLWNPDEKQQHQFQEDWKPYQADKIYDNGFKVQWEAFICNVIEGGKWSYGLDKAARAVEVADASLASWAEGKWLTL